MDNILFIGSHLSHSLLPLVYSLIEEQVGLHLNIVLAEMNKDEFIDLFKQDGLPSNVKFCVVTFPYKLIAAALVDVKTERALESNSVNIVYKDSEGRLVGDNTDGKGFITDIHDRLNLEITDCDVMVLGDGGVSKGIIPELVKISPREITVCHRIKQNGLLNFDEKTPISLYPYESTPKKNYKLVINATSASIYNEVPPLELHDDLKTTFFYECAYLPDSKTPFERYLNEYDIVDYSNGIGMLIEQAALAIENLYQIKVDTLDVFQKLMKMIEKSYHLMPLK